MALYAMRIIALLWLVHSATQVLADLSPTGGVTMTEIYTSGQNGAASAITFYPVIYPGADDLNVMTRSNYSAYTTTAPPYVYGPNDFIDCDSYSKSRSHPATLTSLPASGTAPTYGNASTLNGTITVPTSRTGPITIAPHATVTPPIPFEEYWCSSYASTAPDSALLSFQNNGTNRPQFHGLDPSAKTVCMSVEAENYSKWATTHAPSTSVGGFWSAVKPVVWTPTLTPPCCNTFCNLVVPSAQMQYWPTPAPAAMKNRTTFVGPDGFTFTSPSVYVFYKGISATNDCGQTLGSTTVDLTLSYAPSDMITFSNRREGGYTYKTIDFATIWSNCTDRYTYSSQPSPPCAKTITTEEANCDAQISSIGANALFWQDHCYPQLSFPPTTRLQELNTAWQMCDMGNVDTSILGVFDPPRALKPGTAMVAPATTETAGLPIPPIAQPASQAVPSQPEKTASPSAAQVGNDPSSNTNVNPAAGAESPKQGGAVDPSNEAPPTQTSKAQDPQQAGDSKLPVPAPINAPNPNSPAANAPVGHQAGTNNQPPTNNLPATNNQPAAGNIPVVNQSPSDPNNESAAQMSALHQALAPAPAASPQSPSQQSGTPQQVAGSPANAPPPANPPASNGGSQPAEPASNQNQGANPSSSGSASGGSQPASGGSQPANGGFQAAHGGTQPASGGSQPASGGSQPANGGSQPANGGSQPANGGSQPANEGSQPASGGTQPASGGSQPANGGFQAANGGTQPASGGSQPASGGSQPANGGSQPASGGSQPANGGSQPASGGSQPANGGSQAANGGTLPANGGFQSANGGSQLPVIPAQNQGSSPPSDGAANSGGSLAGQVAQNQGPSPAKPVPAASPPPQFVIPVASGETLSGAVINSNSIILAGPSGGATVQAGAPATQVLGHTISIGPAGSSAIVDGQVHALTMQTPAAINNNNQAAVTPGSSHDAPLPVGNSQNQPVAGPGLSAPQQNGGGQGPVAVAPAQPYTSTIANHVVAAIPSAPGAIIVDGQTISHGAAPVLISNTPVVYNSNGNLVLGTQTISSAVPSVAPLQPPPVTTTIANHAIAAIPSSPGALLIDGQTISQGSGPTTISNTPIVYHSNGDLVVGTRTVSNILPSIASPPSAIAPAVFTVAGQVASVLPKSAGIAIAGATLLPNEPAIAISGTVSASYGSAGLVVGTSTIALPSLSPIIAAPVVLTVGDQVATILPNNAGIAIAGTTLQANGAAVPISGTVSASYGPAGLVVGTSTAVIPSTLPPQGSLTSITLAGQVFTYAVSPSSFASVGPNGVIIGTSTIPYTSTATNGAVVTGASTLLYTSALIGTSNLPYTSTGSNGAVFTGISTSLYTSPIGATGTQSVGGLILGALNPSGPRSENTSSTQTGASSTSSVAGPTGLAGTSGAGGQGEVPTSGARKVGLSIGALWIGALMAMIVVCWV